MDRSELARLIGCKKTNGIHKLRNELAEKNVIEFEVLGGGESGPTHKYQLFAIDEWDVRSN